MNGAEGQLETSKPTRNTPPPSPQTFSEWRLCLIHGVNQYDSYLQVGRGRSDDCKSIEQIKFHVKLEYRLFQPQPRQSPGAPSSQRLGVGCARVSPECILGDGLEQRFSTDVP